MPDQSPALRGKEGDDSREVYHGVYLSHHGVRRMGVSGSCQRAGGAFSKLPLGRDRGRKPPPTPQRPGARSQPNRPRIKQSGGHGNPAPPPRRSKPRRCPHSLLQPTASRPLSTLLGNRKSRQRWTPGRARGICGFAWWRSRRRWQRNKRPPRTPTRRIPPALQIQRPSASRMSSSACERMPVRGAPSMTTCSAPWSGSAPA